MAEAIIGARVVALRDASSTDVNIYGYGTYEGKHECAKLGGIPNPRIKLDDDKGTVWGWQCWWGLAENFDNMVKGRNVNVVDLPVVE